MSIKSSITPNYTLFWILKSNKNGYFHYFWLNKWLFLPKNWYQSWYQYFLHEYQYQYRYRISELHGISISIGIKTSDLYSISIVSVSTFQTWKVSVSYRYRKKWYRRPLAYSLIWTVSKANTPSKMNHTMRNGMKNHAREWCQKLLHFCLRSLLCLKDVLSARLQYVKVCRLNIFCKFNILCRTPELKKHSPNRQPPKTLHLY